MEKLAHLESSLPLLGALSSEVNAKPHNHPTHSLFFHAPPPNLFLRALGTCYFTSAGDVLPRSIRMRQVAIRTRLRSRSIVRVRVPQGHSFTFIGFQMQNSKSSLFVFFLLRLECRSDYLH